jgi:hypothetical protein
VIFVVHDNTFDVFVHIYQFYLSGISLTNTIQTSFQTRYSTKFIANLNTGIIYDFNNKVAMLPLCLPAKCEVCSTPECRSQSELM